MCSLRGDLSLPARSRQNQIYTFIPTVSGFNSENILQKDFSIFKHFVESDWTDKSGLWNLSQMLDLGKFSFLLKI